jgi:hypothetical protein
MMSIGTRPLGALLAGLLGALIGIRPTLWLAAVGGLLAFVWLTPPGLLTFRIPETRSPS